MVHHEVKQGFTVAAALHALVNVEVEYADRTNLLNNAVLIADEQVTLTNLDEADDLTALGADVKSIVAAEQTTRGGDH